MACGLLEKKNRDWGPKVKGEANGRKLAGLNGLQVTVSARTTALEFIASGFDARKLLSGRKAQSFRDTIFQCINVSVFKFDDAIAIHTDEMAVSGMINVVGVVQHLIFAEIQLFKKAALHKERQRSINRCTGYRRLNFTSPLQKLICRIVIRVTEGRLNDRIPLSSPAKTASLDEFIDSFTYRQFHVRRLTVKKGRVKPTLAFRIQTLRTRNSESSRNVCYRGHRLMAPRQFLRGYSGTFSVQERADVLANP